MSRLRLFVCQPSKARKQFEVGENQIFVVGRGPQSHTRSGDPEMSRNHFTLQYDGDEILVTDLNSSTGTFHNGLRVQGVASAKNGDEIQAGKTRIFLSSHGNTNEAIHSKDVVIDELGGMNASWLSNFFLKRIVGVGKTGLVFEAFDEGRGRSVALKIFSKKFTDNKIRQQQFIRGIQAVRKLQHPNLIRLLQAGKNRDDYYYIAMQYIDGKSLDKTIKHLGIENMVDWKETWRCAYEIGTALALTYENDIVHRNVFPRNIMRRDSDGAFLLGDFSRAMRIDPEHKSWKGKEFVSDLHYIPPERIQDETGRIQDSLGNFNVAGVTDIRSDIFGLGASCYAMLTGKPPADGIGLSELFDSIRADVPPLPTQSHLAVNEQFQSVVMKMIAKNPNNRFQTPQELIKELSRVGRLSGVDF